MPLKTVAGILCAIGMFLFGIDIIGDGISLACGDKMKSLLAVFTKNRFTGVLTGFIVTAVIQSSSATTVMAVNFVENNLLSFSKSVGIIMGANIGTTVTSLLLAVNFSHIAPLAVFFGAGLKMFSKKEKLRNTGLIICGFGLIFVAMSSMGEYMTYFKESGKAEAVISVLDGKLQCILTGFLITAIMQSSSATIGVLQSAASSGLISLQSAVFVLFGQNIGAVVPTLLSSIKCEKQAKKTAVLHLLFNVFGTALFVFISIFTPYIHLLEKIPDLSLAVSVSHIVFNVISTAFLLPFGNVLEFICEKIVDMGSKNKITANKPAI